MPPGDVDLTQKSERGSAPPEQSLFAGIAALDAAGASLAGYRARTDPALQLATMPGKMQTIQQQIESLQQQDQYYSDLLARHPFSGDLQPGWRAARGNFAAQISELSRQMQELEASKPLLERDISRMGEQEKLDRMVRGRLESFISGKDFGVSPEERELITQGIQGISQDVATSRGLNPTDVPVMQAVAPAVSQALLAQGNANRSLFTGINQFQQGMDLSGRQLLAGMAGQNPAANLTGVYAGLASGIQGSNQSRGLGGADVLGMVGQGAMGLGLGAYGLGASGLLGGAVTMPAALGPTSTALSAFGTGMSMSDTRLKQKIIKLAGALEAVRKLSGYAFQWRATEQPGHGVLAQEVEQVLPRAVTERQGVKHVDYAAIIAVLVEAVKELDAKVQAQHG